MRWILLFRQCSVWVVSNRPCSKYRFAAWAPPQKPKYGQATRQASTPVSGGSDDLGETGAQYVPGAEVAVVRIGEAGQLG